MHQSRVGFKDLGGLIRIGSLGGGGGGAANHLLELLGAILKLAMGA